MKNSSGFGIEIIVDGRPLTEYTKDGKTYVAAPWNKDYQLRLHVPRRGARYLAVTSVDGLDIMTGKTASKNAGGYVITPASHATDNDIPGFRLNKNEVAAFHFGDRADSYAALLDKPANIGVIAVVFFSEYEPLVFEVPGGSFECLGGGTKGAGHDMGTEFGRRTEHRVNTTTFERDREVARFVIEYASREKLVEAGIITEAPLGDVDPFPGDNGGACTPPRGWRG